MKQTIKAAIILGLSMAVSAQTLLSQQFNLTIDENGHGTVNGAPLGFTVGPDPTGGITNSPVLMYTLPFDVQGGDVLLLEPGQPNAPYSDLIRFFEPTPGGNSSLLIFYSDFEAGEPRDLADVGIPATSTTFVINETGPEGNNGATWNPALPEPGTPLLGGPVTGTAQYNVMSDVPEPGAPTLLVAGAVILGMARRFCWRKQVV